MDALKKIILEKIEREWKISFADFMEAALYYPELGYYERQKPFGKEGSFYTSVNTSSVFGRCLARSFYYVVSELKLPSYIYEFGAGSGLLASDILDFYKDHFNKFYDNLKYYIIEKSSLLIKEQKKLLTKHISKVEWLGYKDLKNIEGICFSNELIDAFPVHRIIKIGEDIKELYVINYEDKLQFYPDDIVSSELKEFVNKNQIKLKLIDRQIADINLIAAKWIESLSNAIKRGVIITIDYGDTADKLYNPYRMDGTVTCYYKHTQNNDFFERVGEQDITAFVDFTTLIKYAATSNTEKIALLPQWQYLLLSGILEDLEKAGSDLERANIKTLIIPAPGFGTNFYVLLQGKNANVNEKFKYKMTAKDYFNILK
mgnify:CR=1 FL=1|jgi:SAM-dependent MidA family methyltransferase